MSEILKKAGATASAASGKVVAREVISASAEAARVLEAVRQEAHEILAGAEQARQEAVESGYREGFEQGAAQWVEALRIARRAACRPRDRTPRAAGGGEDPAPADRG